MRRTAAEKKEILDLLENVLQRAEEIGITSYEFNKSGIDMTIPGFNKILTRQTKMPNIEVVKAMDDYIRKNYEEKKTVVAEEKESYGIKDIDLKKVYEKLGKIEDKIDNGLLKQDIIFEIIKNAKEAELEKMNAMIKEKLNSLQA